MIYGGRESFRPRLTHQQEKTMKKFRIEIPETPAEGSPRIIAIPPCTRKRHPDGRFARTKPRTLGEVTCPACGAELTIIESVEF